MIARNRRRSLALAALGGVLLAAPGARAQEPAAEAATRFAVALDVDTLWRLDGAYRLVTRERAGTDVGLSLSYEARQVGRRGALAVELGWHPESLAEPFGGGHHAALDVDRISLAGLLRLRLLPWLEPHARLAVGGAFGTLAIRMQDGGSFEGDAFSAEAAAGAGVRLRSRAATLRNLPGRPRAALAATVEGGFSVGTSMRFAVAPPAPEDEDLARDRLVPDPVDVGRLGRAHPYLRVSAAVLF